MSDFYRNKTLNELEGSLEEQEFNSSLTKRCSDLRNKKLKDFDAGDIRVMISQKMSLSYMIPIAIDMLAINPFVEGDFYTADLLVQVLQVDNEFWEKNEFLYYEFNEVIVDVKSTLELLLPVVMKFDSTK
ncbi:contact-dependent growth inhibition system immunity protein [Bacillus spongiae]|uniref:Contact-dependent growth inhibition system immunity protein n=1 Tax=Bacillus spongiae TaxID=2683610 RepID=A0ABU8HKB6_9BACI